GLGTVAAIAAVAQAISLLPRPIGELATTGEAVAVAIAVSLLSPANDTAVPYLAVPVLIAGLRSRVRGVLLVLALEAGVLAGGYLVTGTDLERAEVARLIVWLVTAFGIGMLGASIHRLLTESESQGNYRNALVAIEQLHQVSGRLSHGLEVGTISGRLLDRARQVVPLETAALVARDASGNWAAIQFSGRSAAAELRDVLPRAEAVRTSGRPWTDGTAVAVPLTRNGNIVAVLVGRGHDVDASHLSTIDGALEPDTLRLEAALLFADVTASATSEERQRLAREIHDGIAQDLASLGYLIDGVDVSAPDANAHLDGIREEITRVLQEVRHSVFGLRADVTEDRTLGEGVSALAQHVRTHSPITVHETIVEGPSRLRADVEVQLLRIIQEAMNNARKHSGAENIWVRCRLEAPLAEIEVLDDGAGLGRPRNDSHGLAIMRERAERIGAHLDVESRPDSARGTRVLVTLGGTDDHR
ncbi:MAG TPA: histidine kinase, partial [Marmoricola sp.]